MGYSDIRGAGTWLGKLLTEAVSERHRSSLEVFSLSLLSTAGVVIACWWGTGLNCSVWSIALTSYCCWWGQGQRRCGNNQMFASRKGLREWESEIRKPWPDGTTFPSLLLPRACHKSYAQIWGGTITKILRKLNCTWEKRVFLNFLWTAFKTWLYVFLRLFIWVFWELIRSWCKVEWLSDLLLFHPALL